MFECKRPGCHQKFKHKTQLYRHKRKCQAVSPQKKKASYTRENDSSWTCLKCSKIFSQQSNVVRHVVTCKVKENEIHQCSFCNQGFKYKSYLQRHERSHRNDVLVASFVNSSVHILSNSVGECSSKFNGENDCEDNLPVDSNDLSENSHVVCSSSTDPDFVIHTPVPVADSLGNPSSDSEDNTARETSETSMIELSQLNTDLESQETENDGELDANEDDILNCLMSYLKSLYERPPRAKFMETMEDIFGSERLSNKKFLYCISSKLNINYSNLKRCMKNWRKSGMKDARGRKLLPLETRQIIYDEWIANAQTSTDNRNGRCQIKISKSEYLLKYSGIKNKDIEVVEEKNREVD